MRPGPLQTMQHKTIRQKMVRLGKRNRRPLRRADMAALPSPSLVHSLPGRTASMPL